MTIPPIGIKIGSKKSLPEKWPKAINAKPIIKMNIGAILWWFFLNDEPKDQIPKNNESEIMPISTHSLAKKLKPHKGRNVIKRGTIAQWMAQSTDAVMPKLSKFIGDFKSFMWNKL